jgi:hypothetical protein
VTARPQGAPSSSDAIAILAATQAQKLVAI